jgi:Helix-turn-helix.
VQSPLTWRDLLGRIVNAAQDKQRIADGLGITPITLSRWISGESVPRPQNLRLLLYIFPEHRSQFLDLLHEEFCPAFMVEVEADAIPYEIPSSFYAQILRNHCQLPRITHLRDLCESIVQQGLRQMDPNNAGLYLAVFRCTPPLACHKVRSLYEDTWGMTFENPRSKHMPIRPFFGRESLVGDVVYTGQPRVIHSRVEGQQQFPHGWWTTMESAIACPIHRADSYAGCLLVYSLLPEYFRLLSRQTLVRQFADLLALAFEPDDYYLRRDIDLACLPAFIKQVEMAPSSRQRLALAMSQNGVNLWQAERLVMQQIEGELLNG